MKQKKIVIKSGTQNELDFTFTGVTLFINNINIDIKVIFVLFNKISFKVIDFI